MSNIVSEELKNKAISLGLCQQWQSEWGSLTKDQLVELYLRGIHWSMERAYPSVRYINEHFSDLLLDNNIFTEGDHFLLHEYKAVGRGTSRLSVMYDMYDAGDLYVGDDAECEIMAHDGAIVTIHLYQGAKLTVVRCEDNAKIYVYQYGGGVDIQHSNGNIQIVDKR